MKKTYHLCLSSGNEVLFRSKEDFIRGINCLCLAAYKTGAVLLAYSFMSNHVHICARTNSSKKLIRAFRYAYTRYFNAKYDRRGSLGDHGFFQMKIEGLYHLLTAIAYILRNPMHHGVTGTPFGYPYSSDVGIFVAYPCWWAMRRPEFRMSKVRLPRLFCEQPDPEVCRQPNNPVMLKKLV